MPEEIKKKDGGTVLKGSIELCDPSKENFIVDLWASDAGIPVNHGWQPGAVLLMDVYLKAYRGEVTAGG